LAADEGDGAGLAPDSPVEVPVTSGLLLLVSSLRLVQALRVPQSTAAAMPTATPRGMTPARTAVAKVRVIGVSCGSVRPGVGDQSGGVYRHLSVPAVTVTT